MSVLVFGSINMDLVARLSRLPQPGETLTGRSFETVPGGKGANQAVAVARLGVPVELVGRVGADEFGRARLADLQANGVLCDRVQVDATTHSGVAIIQVDDTSENTITVIPGANGNVGVEEVDRLAARFSTATILLLQLEIPLPAVVAAAKAAKQAGVTVILDPAPALPTLPAELYANVDILTPNQVEASHLVGFPVHDRASAEQATQVLRDRGVATAIVKLGKQGALCRTATDCFEIPAFPVNSIDTVAAGDAFNGGLAAALTTGRSLRDATRIAAAVAALSVTKSGAQSSLPTQAEVDRFLRDRSTSTP